MATDWRERYADKLVPAATALEGLKAGSRVFVGSVCGEPQALVRALTAAGQNVADTEVMQVLTLGVAPYSDPKYAGSFRANAFFIGNNLRGAVNEARADYTPMFLSQIPALFKTHRVHIDVALIMVSPPDEHGFCSLGVSVDITKSAADAAKVVIAQVNRFMPRALGDCFVHVNQIDFLVEHDEPLLEWPAVGGGDEVTQQIGANIARLVPDGATLQLGIGRIPDAVMAELADKNDLGIHTEMFSDGVMKLAQSGVITGGMKSMHPGKIVGSFAAGSRALFDFMHNNPMIELHPSEYTNDPFIIARHDGMVAINSALEVDLTGQVVADSLGQVFYSGIGGHADFMRGAAMSINGKPIIAMPSTADTPNGLKSRIVATVQDGAGVTATRGDAYYIVTEYGVAFLHGRNLRERAMALINIAHPDYRSDLLYAAKRRRIVYADQIIPPPRRPYPAELETTYSLEDGRTVLVRPIKPDDEPLIKEMFYSFSEQTVYLRYHALLKSMPHNRLQVFCHVDYDTEMAFVATVGPPGEEDIIAVGRYMCDPAKELAEVAFVVRDDYQRQGLGSYLFKRLVEVASARGIRKFEASVLAENVGMLTVFHRSGLVKNTSTDAGVVRVDMASPAGGGTQA
jgi:acyl-CoA hydrolase/GNAT superfamily N-acetyltransferase